MATHRARGVSPPRRLGDPRVPANPVFSTGFDTRYAQQPRNSIDTLTSSRTGGERLYDAQPISRKNFVASGHSAAQSKTEYAIRPRNTSNAGDDGRSPLRILPPPTSPTSSRTRPLVNNLSYDQPRSPLTKRYYPPDESDRYILPAASSPRLHRRQVSAATADPSNLAPAGRDRREQRGYRVAGARVYPTNRSLVRYNEEDDYSYTNPREQFDRDYPPSEPRAPRNSYTRRDRPISSSDFDDWKTIPKPKRDPGPPPAVRQFDRIGEVESRNPASRSGNYSDTERDLEQPRRRHSMRAPVSVHQDRLGRSSPSRDDHFAQKASQYRSRGYENEPSYSSDRENYRPSSHYERHRQRTRPGEEIHDNSSKHHGVAAAGLGGLAAAGLTSALVKKSREKDDESDRDEPREVKDRYAPGRDHNFGDATRDRERIGEKPRDRAAELRDEVAPREHRRDKARRERSDSDSVEEGHIDGHRHRRKHRHRRRENRPQELDSDSASNDGKGVEVAELDRVPRERDSAQDESDLPRRDRRHSHTRKRVLSNDERAGKAPIGSERDEDEEERAARLQLVEPPKEKEPSPKPKGILKPARQVPFPEDPNPTREGVAPLKDAGKKGIPPGARWTKINRMLVNPAALEEGHERYEERPDYVIVLRVLSREEIQKFADKTREIRGKSLNVSPFLTIRLTILHRGSGARISRAIRTKMATRG